MNHSRNHRQSPLAPFPGQSTPRLRDRVEEVLRPRTWRFFVMATLKSFMQVSLGESYS
jgi:hypothetical protein